MRLIDAELFRDELYRHYELLNVDDYEVWAVVDVDEVLFNIEEIKAIPVEWLQKKYDKWKDRDMLGWSYCVKLLIEDWEKENENN